MRRDSLAVHAGHEPRVHEPMNPPLYQTSVYVFDELDDYDAVAKGERPGHIYARSSNENVGMLASAVAALEGAEDGAATSTGTSAVLIAVMALCPSPRPIVVPRDLYGGTWVLMRDHFGPLGYEVRFVDVHDDDALRRALDGAGLALCESITNPLQRVTDLPRVGELCRSARVPLVVDNSYATPILCRPLEAGATACVHSVTKYLSGHWDLMAGVVAADAWNAIAARDVSNRLGTTLGPFEAWLGLRGLRTLALRMRRHSDNALALACELERMPQVQRVHYPLLESSPDFELAKRLLTDGAGGMLAFDLPSREDVQRLIDRLRMTKFAASFGGAETAVSHPEITSHRYLTPDERAALGITPGTVRVSTGIEDVADIVEDFRRALG